VPSLAPSRRRASGTLPPPENAMSRTVALGATIPSAVRASVVSTGTQPAPRRTRIGSTDSVIVKLPSGFATTRRVWLVIAVTTTRLWEAAAATRACSSSIPDGAGVGAAHEDGEGAKGAAARKVSASAAPTRNRGECIQEA